MSDDPQVEPPPEPSVLDYVKSKLSFGRRAAVVIPAPELLGGAAPLTSAAEDRQAAGSIAQRHLLTLLPWRSLMALGFALLGQALFEPPTQRGAAGSLLCILGAAALLWSNLRGEWGLPAPPEPLAGVDALNYRRRGLIAAIPLATLAFLSLGGNLFTLFNLSLWLGAIGLLIWSLWLPGPAGPSILGRLRLLLAEGEWRIHVSRWSLVLLAACAVIVFFRVYHIQGTPAEPFSDHAEKLLDVYDISQGQTRIFFPRNTGREALQMYWTLLVSWLFGTGFSFLSLKIGTVLIGLLTLPYVYLLGTEVATRRVGLLAVLLAGVGYWPNLIARIGLRFPLYAMFVAPVIFHLIRGLRTRNRNDFILTGVFLGLGLHGYSPSRIVPLLVAAAFAIYALHGQSAGARRQSVVWLAITAVTSLLIFLPLLRYATDNPDSFSYRALTRLEGIEQPLAGPWYMVFLSNTWNALRMFNWNNGGIWVHSVPDRPALDVVAGALFLIGAVLILTRYVLRHDWRDLFLITSIPILLLPSILSLAFPSENPSLNRTAGALVPAFVIAALALDGLIAAFGQGRARTMLALGMAGALLWGSASQSFQLVFRQFDDNFRRNAWNSSEMGAVIRGFAAVYGRTDTAWVVPFPYWVDTRLVGVWAGVPNRDFALWTDEIPKTLQVGGPKLFIVKASLANPDANDDKAIDLLEQLYPQGSLSLHRSPVAEHDFWIYLVPSPSSP